MKTLLLLVAVTASVVFTSCNKNYLCMCKSNMTGETVRGNVNAPNGREARKACEGGNGQAGSTYTCTLQ
ncbi:MAG: hypothetical protein JST82_01910 [Bacteroidetes bacterium]|nr:hypothetical protein [Bacteroidota bacterium]